jgi:hypothetical protein
MVAQAGDTGVSTLLAQPSWNGAIGFGTYSSALAAGLPVAKVLNSAGYYTAPTAANVGLSLLNAQVNGDGTANLSGVYTNSDPRTYELSYYSYLILPTDTSLPLTPDQGYSLGAFGSFLLCQGQQQVDGLGYAALPVNLVADGYAQLQNVPGASLPATSSAFLSGCQNPTISANGTDALSGIAPMPASCDQQGIVQCNTGAVPTVTTVTASPDPTTVGRPVTMRATVAPANGAIPTGSVQFEVGSTLIGSPVTLDSFGVATTTETFTTTGTQLVTAVFTPAVATAFDPSADMVSVSVNPSVAFTLTTTVPPTGAFTFTVPSNGTITLTVSGGTATGVMVPVTVTDTRNTYPGWSVVGQVSDFTNPASHPAGDISGDQLGWVPNFTSNANVVLLGGTVAPAAPGLGTTAAMLASAGGGGGFGTSTLGAALTLAIPPTAPSGDYTGVLTLTANPTAP